MNSTSIIYGMCFTMCGQVRWVMVAMGTNVSGASVGVHFSKHL